ncbi:MAG: hypothetical protein A3H98_05640 [Bacteroidetes bacterium RIFCSPLOWO2_02_FULL_36_8]|nr:MAG: hypothetical protein A3H98_05640 [Bacteroidetes bacterium RIFCSPLOWO2_02_FULL_36_8]OFY68839.1 MAG: hypothetical protein A3G23_03360 [Bacteroidetes bacterium RIFCSPLOWO2_12_FULL_37_12]
MRSKSYLFFIIFLFFSCKDFTTKKLSDSEKQELEFRIKNEMDSINFYWNVMAKSMDEELKNIKHLIDLIAVVEGCDSVNQKKALLLFQDFSKIKYTMKMISASDSIDYFDNKMTEIIEKTFEAARNSPNLKMYPLYEQLVNEIKKADDEILHLRIRYDENVFGFRKLKEENKKLLSQLGENYKNLPEFPVFTITPTTK